MDLKLLAPERVQVLLSWKHSGFNVHTGEPVPPENKAELEKLAQYILRNPFSVEKMTMESPADTIIYRSKLNPKINRNFEVFTPTDFLAAITQHIPDQGAQMVRYYGWYSNKMRGQRHRAQHGGAASAPLRPPSTPPPPAKLPSKKWRDLIMQVWHTDPLICPRCQHPTEENEPGITHHLLDGQQRCDAIVLGYKDPFRALNGQSENRSSDSILWLDLDPDRDEWSTREFVARLTTSSHPWGYSRGDATQPLGANEIREALARIGRDPKAESYRHPTPVELCPQKANVPVPLAWLLLNRQMDDFWTSILRRLNGAGELPWHSRLREFLKDPDRGPNLTRILQALQRIEHTEIIALCVPDTRARQRRARWSRGARGASPRWQRPGRSGGGGWSGALPGQFVSVVPACS